jgi:hypothetical protein
MRASGIAVAALAAWFALTGTASATPITYEAHLTWDWDGTGGPGQGAVTSSRGDFTIVLDENGNIASSSGTSLNTLAGGVSFTFVGSLFVFPFGSPDPVDLNFNTAGSDPGYRAGAASDIRLIVWAANGSDWLLTDHLNQLGDQGASNTNAPYAYLSFTGDHRVDGLTYNYDIQAVPEPASFSLVLAGLGAGTGIARRWRARSIQ